MTNQELEKLNIISVGSKLYPRRFFVPQAGEIDIPGNWEINDIFEAIYHKGYIAGTRNGENLKVLEIKKCFFIED